MTSDLIQRIDRFLSAGWKEQTTCLALVRELQQHLEQIPSSTLDYHNLRKKLYRLQSIHSNIVRLTIGVNPSVVHQGATLLPCVAWLPQPILDEDTSMVVYPPQPTLPIFTSKAERCHYLKQQADAALEEDN